MARAANLLFPPACPISGEPVAAHGTLSPAAWGELFHLTAPWCDGCGMPFSDAGQGPLCAACAAPADFPGSLVGPRRLGKFRAALAYDDGAAGAILALKYGDRHDGIEGFGHLMAAATKDLLPGRGDVLLVPVPLHPSRLRQRRYNQAGLLAEATARHLGLRVDHLALRRKRPTPSQKGASNAQRARNVAGAFAVQDGEAVKGAHIILVDDVLTTGATVQACARALKSGGAAGIDVLTLARVAGPRRVTI